MRPSKQKKWNRRFLDHAKFVSQWSKDPSTKCGATVFKGNRIISIGFNGFPAGVSDSKADLNNRELKLEKVIHAEINAILHAGKDLTDCSIAVYPFPPCARCASIIIQSGITSVVTVKPEGDLEQRWKASLKIASDMFKEAGVTLIYM